jgi:multicomponent K+:H+ antiporter subunit D
MNHFVVLPILLPLIAGATSLVLVRRPALTAAVNLIGCTALLSVALRLMIEAAGDRYGVYHIGNWPAPYGIVLVSDRLSALMLVLTAVVALFSLLYALAGELRRDPHFHALFQFQLLGLNGAFLTGDLFNLFVFFEILLIASYGLLLRGEDPGPRRARAVLHYVVLNLAGSALFLFAVGVVYAVTGTLNMADLARKVAVIGGADIALLRSGALLLLVVFVLKAAVLPLHVWLPAAYGSAAASIAALFAIMTKVGVYAVLRIFTLVFGGGFGLDAGIGEWLLPLAIATMAMGGVGALAAQNLRWLVSYLMILSVGTLLTGIALFSQSGIEGALYYLLHTTLITACLYLLADMISRHRGAFADAIAPGVATAHAGLLGGLFLVAALAVAGLPPLSGFFGKILILEAAADHGAVAWIWGTLLAGTLLAMIALSRAGSAIFWKAERTTEFRPIPALALGTITVSLLTSPALVVFLKPLHDYTAAAALQLLTPDGYVEAVLKIPRADQSQTVADGAP